MKIVVCTIYENIQDAELFSWADRVFDKSWVKQLNKRAFVEELKSEFLNGEKVMAQTFEPDGAAVVTTTWELLK
jgi:hypothetical protein